ncbi:DUF418 domain-containing protein [Ruania halotolerans]|uniref:DUF418 domain-containing protein n=1 Tax=Ruania halotolerans TaxID=2897773 RepID=UPI001E439D35|nr:DUF418 domain-containing protein [Ruania halotolerans]UFU07458.1 DUF418 domain-containing protein [Ruania halotolerans]
MTSHISSGAHRGPVSASERALAPDLARGFMLLLIALANTPWYLYGQASGASSAHPVDGSILDRVVQFVLIVAVDARIYPLFAFLFGYGIVQLYRRQIQAGVADGAARAILRRRHWWMIIVGAVHAALLWFGDIVGAYGLVGLVMVAIFFRRMDRTLIVWAIVLTTVLAAVTVLAVISLPFIPEDQGFDDASFMDTAAISGEQNYATSVLMRLATWPLIAVAQGLIGLVVPTMVLLAFWASRRQILEHPQEHRRLLRRTAAIGVSIGMVGGLPNALSHVGVVEVGAHHGWIFQLTQSFTGLFGGLGYVALFTLIADRLQRSSAARRAPVVAIQAVGKRSLSSYLGQSILFAPLLSAWGFGLGGNLNSAGMAAIACAGWLLLAAGAFVLERRGTRGPAESVLRRLAYR